MSSVVLLHAFPLDHRMYDGVVDDIAQAGWDVFTPDIRGFGTAPSWNGIQPSLAQCADDVVAMLDQYGVDKAVIGGCSLGGYIAMQMLRTAPERVAGLIFIDTKASADSEEAIANRLRVAASVEEAKTTEAFWRAMLPNLLGETTQAHHPETVEEVRALLADSSVDGVANLQRAMAARPDSHADIAAFHGPVLSIRGTQDKVASAEDHQKMMDVSREGIHIDIEECGHLAPIEKPEETSRAIIEFLNSVKKISC